MAPSLPLPPSLLASEQREVEWIPGLECDVGVRSNGSRGSIKVPDTHGHRVYIDPNYMLKPQHAATGHNTGKMQTTPYKSRELNGLNPTRLDSIRLDSTRDGTFLAYLPSPTGGQKTPGLSYRPFWDDSPCTAAPDASNVVMASLGPVSIPILLRRPSPPPPTVTPFSNAMGQPSTTSSELSLACHPYMLAGIPFPTSYTLAIATHLSPSAAPHLLSTS
ncbi:hypothetical protein CPLU01_01662 [Colletotrichum plurivorum]|uniref:Uncharacterized protein n=1 Tax=Colletotrichum plurivorum TaxID=2175906 RepID=A0A8H6U433_9PEZI|nr:hypothetical protein CPLU01_01662 [Colletotrichum plurivorum]